MSRKHIFSSVALLVVLWAVLGSCYLSRKVPTEAVSRQGMDSVQVGEESISLSGLRVLLVSRADTVNGRDSLVQEFSGWWDETEYYSVAKQNTLQNVQTSFYDQLVAEKVSNELKVHTDALEVSMATVLSEGQLDKLCRDSRFDLLIVNERVSFLAALDTGSRHVTPVGVVPFPVFSSGGGYSYTVYYASRWRLLWRDASQSSGFREQPIVQRGGYWVQKRERSAGGVLACALKAGEDFARLFR